ncbi:PQQ-binding-like beta-propeller repeat protein [Devosia ginsengisoli]|uniref:PQQ-binding-like beta-propeller repeat protein n=1 Tax=Devosia ginsengisoli TaxID=400770 RepID=A0A5B8LTR8_9HYPH|nr:PQQ-binding-like beta-propeller repeat protein [Devosia ginsengisoli]QDZ10680.1 PQQ-binding-like beta-propeller repeat protein [Devosia ginsengisoli]
MAQANRGFGYWAVVVLAAIMVIFGLPILLGGIWLIALGGSWYYALAGLGLLISAWFLFRHSMLGVWLYLVTFMGTLAWALWEVGFDGWAQVPRLVAPTVILVLVLATIPALYRDRGRMRGAVAAGVAGLAVLASIGLVFNLSDNNPVIAQEQEPEPQEPQPAVPAENPADAVLPDDAGDAPGGVAPTVDPGPGTVPEATDTTAAPPAADAAPAATLASPTGVVLRAAMPMPQTGADWPAYGGTQFGTRHSPLAQITPDNVATLERVWEFNTGVMPPDPKPETQRWSPENTPLKIGDDLFICTPTNVVIAVDARSGLEEWRYDPGISPDVLAIGACRGVAYFEDPEAAPDDLCARRIIAGTEDGRLLALDADMGQLCPEFGDGGQLSVEEGLGDTVPRWIGLTSAPTIIRGIAVVGYNVNDNEDEDAPSGVVRGYDAVTGELVWAWDLGNPDNRGAPAGGEVYTRGTPNMWTTAAADEELGLVYLPLGNSAVDYFGSNRSEAENDYATSLVAVDVTTGEDVWHFQTVHHDVWDYDLGSQPALVDFPAEGGSVPAVLISSKQGDIYVLNRETGEPLFVPEEREVPQGGVEPDYLSPVQPFSTYHSLAMDPLEERDMWGMTPLDQLWCRIQYRQASYEGMYTPPTTDWYIQYPGYNGGQDWGSMAVDEERGILIANYNDVPNRLRLVERTEAEEAGISTAIYEDGVGGDPQIGAPYAIEINVGWRSDFTKLMCKQPPYGGLRAIDLATGETLWDQPFGSARRNGPFNIPSMLPLTIGTPNNGGPIVTASGLIFVAATTDDMIRAYSIETGEELWSDELPAGGQATPIVYEVEGTQYLAMMAGGHTPMETRLGDAVIAWALADSPGAADAEQSGGE